MDKYSLFIKTEPTLYKSIITWPPELKVGNVEGKHFQISTRVEPV